MVKKLLKIKDIDHPVRSFRFREVGRSTVTLSVELEYAAAVALFTEPGEWSVVCQYEDEPDAATDCTGYDMLCSIRDTRDGQLEIVMGKITDSEALAELMEVLG